jgi:DNA (cytosine-5)-methyltransferase 1
MSDQVTPSQLRVLDLFSGIGGFSLGLERAGMRTVAFCEIDPFCRRVLAKHWPDVPIYDDVRNLTAVRLRADGIEPDVICGGFPCQDISSAGHKVGIGGERSGLWSEYARLVGELRPRYVIVENVSALLSRGLGDVLADMAALGYDAEWHCIPASAIGADHERDRVWIVANPHGHGEPTGAVDDEARRVQTLRGSADAECRVSAMAIHLARAWRQQQSIPWDRVWSDEDSPMGMGMDDGLPQRLDRLRALGNAVVPQIPELIGRALMSTQQEPSHV